jgi:23S rRNA (uracil1939-C5)-methyltransferase
MSNPLNYRNKAQYPVSVSGESIITGFYAARSHEVIDSEECGIQDAFSNNIRMIVRQFIIDKGITVYNEITGTGLIRHIVTRVGFHTGEVMVVLVINGRALPDGAAEELVKRLTTSVSFPAKEDGEKTITPVPVIKSIYLNINKEKTNVILGPENILLHGSETITDTIGKFSFMISPHSFFQVNPVQTEVLYSKALGFAGLTGAETVFDLYCGIGTITLFLSAKASKVYGVEVVKAAIQDARKNASLNGVKNAEFITGEAEKAVPELYSKGIRADVVVLDPPRKGCEELLLSLFTEMQPKRIVYVSCNPSTLARDLKYLDSRGYRTVEAQPVDMFPWTGHTEAVVRIERVKG